MRDLKIQCVKTWSKPNCFIVHFYSCIYGQHTCSQFENEKSGQFSHTRPLILAASHVLLVLWRMSDLPSTLGSRTAAILRPSPRYSSSGGSHLTCLQPSIRVTAIIYHPSSASTPCSPTPADTHTDSPAQQAPCVTLILMGCFRASRRSLGPFSKLLSKNGREGI